MYAVIIVTIIGIICIVVSFMMVGKEESVSETNDAQDTSNKNHITDEYELNEEEVAVLQRKVSDKISADVNDIIYNADNSLSTMTNEKMMALGDYAVTVCDEIEKNHKEVMFLYSMLNDKHKDLTDLAGELQEFSDNIKNTEIETSRVIESVDEIEHKVEEARPLEQHEFLAASIEKTFTAEKSFSKNSLNSFNNHNAHILRLHGEGVSDVDIAKELGLGLGEVKLVIGLYKGE